jgi:hypothetical protein
MDAKNRVRLAPTPTTSEIAYFEAETVAWPSQRAHRRGVREQI